MTLCITNLQAKNQCEWVWLSLWIFRNMSHRRKAQIFTPNIGSYCITKVIKMHWQQLKLCCGERGVGGLQCTEQVQMSGLLPLSISPTAVPILVKFDQANFRPQKMTKSKLVLRIVLSQRNDYRIIGQMGTSSQLSLQQMLKCGCGTGYTVCCLASEMIPITLHSSWFYCLHSGTCFVPQGWSLMKNP